MHSDRTFFHTTCTHSRRPFKIKSVVCNHLDKEAVEGRRSPPAPSCNGSSSLSTSCSCSPGVPSSPGNAGRVVMLLLSTDPRFLSPGRPTIPVTWSTHASCHVTDPRFLSCELCFLSRELRLLARAGFIFFRCFQLCLSPTVD